MYGDENVWLSQKSMAILFGCSINNVSLHLKNIYEEKELDEKSTVEDFSIVQKEGWKENFLEVLLRHSSWSVAEC